MFSPKIKLAPELHRRAEEQASKLGYSSLTEYVTHLLERELGQATEDEQAVADRLKGLGYL